MHSQRTLLFFFLWILTLRTACHDRRKFTSIFDEISSSSNNLLDQVIQIEREVCGRGSLTTSCRICYVDKLCVMYHDCCPELMLKENITYVEEFVDCRPLVLVPRYSNDEYRKMKSRCPSSVNTTLNDGTREAGPMSQLESDDITKCETPEVTIINQSIPVSSDVTGLVYKNQFCAACHGQVTNLTMWESSIHCAHSPSKLISMAKSKLEMFQILMSQTGVDAVDCELSFTPPPESRPCYPSSTEIINSCNVDGQWTHYDTRVEQACSLYTHVYSGKYKNLFCYICNQPRYIGLTELISRRPEVIRPPKISYSALLDFDDDAAVPVINTESGPSQCAQNQFYDTVDCTCRTPSCSEGKFLSDDGRCESIFHSNFLGYRVCAQILAETDRPLDDPMHYLRQLIPYDIVIRELKMSVSTWCPGDKRIVIDLVSKISGDESDPDDELLTLEDLEREIQSLFLGNQTISSKSGWKTDFFQLRLVQPCPQIQTETFPCSQNKSVKHGSFLQRRSPMIEVDESRMYFIDYTRVTPCPSVSMRLANLSQDVESQSYVYVETNNSIGVNDVHVVNDSEVWLCISDYKILTSADNLTCMSNTDDMTSDSTWTVEGLISLVCTCISLVFLFLTFLTYVILPQLRSGGGKSIIILIVTLFVAQAFFQFLIEQYENQALCVAFGLVIHYSWLAAVFSMNACTIERYLKLCHPIKSRAFFLSKRPFTLGVAYTYICPLIIVVINITANQLTRDDPGYGTTRLCYINSLVSRIVAFAVPIGLIVVVNLCLMVITICTMNTNSSQVKGFKSQTRLGLVACVRLSSLTGFTWLLLFLLEAFPSEALEYIIAALFGLQGVLLFFTLIINKWVLSLLSKKYPALGQLAAFCRCRYVCSRRDQPQTHTSTTQSSNLTHSNDHTLTDLSKSSMSTGAMDQFSHTTEQ